MYVFICLFIPSVSKREIGTWKGEIIPPNHIQIHKTRIEVLYIDKQSVKGHEAENRSTWKVLSVKFLRNCCCDLFSYDYWIPKSRVVLFPLSVNNDFIHLFNLGKKCENTHIGIHSNSYLCNTYTCFKIDMCYTELNLLKQGAMILKYFGFDFFMLKQISSV